MITLLLIIYVVCKIVEDHEDRADWREYDRECAMFGHDLPGRGDTYNIDVDARQVHIHGGAYGDKGSELPPEVQSW